MYFKYEIEEDMIPAIESHKRDVDFNITLPDNAPEAITDLIFELIEEGKFTYKLTPDKRPTISSLSYYGINYSDILKYLYTHIKIDNVVWDIVSRKPEAVIAQENETEEMIEKESFGDLIMDDEGNYHPYPVK